MREDLPGGGHMAKSDLVESTPMLGVCVQLPLTPVLKS